MLDAAPGEWMRGQRMKCVFSFSLTHTACRLQAVPVYCPTFT